MESPDVNGKPVKDAADFFAAGGEAHELVEFLKGQGEWEGRASRSASAEGTNDGARGATRPTMEEVTASIRGQKKI